MKRGFVIISGIAPGLMMGAMSEAQLLSLPGAPGGSKKIQQPKDSSEREVALAKIYRSKDGKAGIPAQNVFSMLKHAGRRVSYGSGRSKVSTATSTFLPEFFWLKPTAEDKDGNGFFPFEALGQDGDIPFIVDKRRGVNEATGGAMCIVRPKFKEWKLKIAFEFDESLVGPDTIEELFNCASTGSGLCEFRPNKGGQFGCFEVVEKSGLEPLKRGDSSEVSTTEVPAAVAGRNGHGAPKTGEPALTV